MQVAYNDGTFGKIEQFDQEKMETLLKRKDVSHEEVFNSTPENLEYRKKILGVKKKSYKKKR